MTQNHGNVSPSENYAAQRSKIKLCINKISRVRIAEKQPNFYLFHYAADLRHAVVKNRELLKIQNTGFHRRFPTVA